MNLTFLSGSYFFAAWISPMFPFVDQIEEEDVRVAITLGVGDDEAEIGLDQLFERGLVVLLHALSELALALRREARHTCDLLQIVVQQVVGVIAFVVANHVLFGVAEFYARSMAVVRERSPMRRVR